MFIVFDNMTGEFLSHIKNEEWGGFYTDNDWKETRDKSGFVTEQCGYWFGEFSESEAAFETKEAALDFVENFCKELLTDALKCSFAVCSVEVEEERRTRGKKVIETKQFATLKFIDVIEKEPFEDSDELTDMEKTLGDLIPENFFPHSENNAEYVAARRIINALREAGYEITKKEK